MSKNLGPKGCVIMTVLALFTCFDASNSAWAVKTSGNNPPPVSSPVTSDAAPQFASSATTATTPTSAPTTSSTSTAANGSSEFSTQLDALVGEAIALYNAPICTAGEALTKTGPYTFACINIGTPGVAPNH